MRKSILIAIWLLLGATTLHSDMNPYILGTIGSGGAACTAVDGMTCATYATISWGVINNDDVCQFVDYSSAITICKVRLQLRVAESTTGSCHIEIRDGHTVATSNQIGGDSSSATITNTTFDGTWHEFTWDSNKPEPSADFYLHVVADNATEVYIAGNTSSTCYIDTNFDCYINSGADTNDDMVFEVYSE